MFSRILLYAGIPMGIDYRIGKKNGFWKKLHLYYEASIGINFSYIPEVQTRTDIGFQQQGGLKIVWEE